MRASLASRGEPRSWQGKVEQASPARPWPAWQPASSLGATTSAWSKRATSCKPIAWYSSGRLHSGELESQHPLQATIVNPDQLDGEKALFFLQRDYAACMVASLPVRVLLLPCVCDQRTRPGRRRRRRPCGRPSTPARCPFCPLQAPLPHSMQFAPWPAPAALLLSEPGERQATNPCGHCHTAGRAVMSVRKALVTLAIGTGLHERWLQTCQPDWQRYGERHGYDSICITQKPLDTSALACARSPAWQKRRISDSFQATTQRIVCGRRCSD